MLKSCQSKNKFTWRLFAVLICLILLLIWLVRYHCINQEFTQNYACTYEIYKIGDAVDLGENTILYDNASGYYVTVLYAEIISADELLNQFQTVPSVDNIPDTLMHINLLIHNQDSNAEGVYFPDFVLHTCDMYTDMNYELTSLSNPFLDEDSYGVQLAQGDEITVDLIYNLRSEHFSTTDYRHLDALTFYLKLTTYPVRKEVRLTLSNKQQNG